MSSILSKDNELSKKEIYDIYTSITRDYCDFDSCVKEDLITDLLKFYVKRGDFKYYLNQEELLLLNKVYHKNESCDYTEWEYSLLNNLVSKMIISKKEGYSVYEEIKPLLEKTIEYSQTEAGKYYYELKDMCMGLCAAYGALEETEFFETLSKYMDVLDDKKAKELIQRSHFLGKSILYMPIDGKFYFAYNDASMVETFFVDHFHALILPKYEFSHEDLKTMAYHRLNINNTMFKRFMDLLDSVEMNYSKQDFYDSYFKNINLMEDSQFLREYLYEIFPHDIKNRDKFFKLLDLCEDVNEEMNSWIVRGDGVFKLGDLFEQIRLSIDIKNGNVPDISDIFNLGGNNNNSLN